jgi:hypothetical protein
VADNLLRPPTPDMQGRELVQWLQRVYDVLREYQTTPTPEPPDIPTSHNDLDDNGGDDSHATIASHIAASTAHGVSSPLVGITDVQSLANKVVNALNNTITNLRHGTEVDNPTAAHGVEEIVGTDETQVLKNKTIYGQYNTVRNMRHGIEVDNPLAAHGAEGAVVGTSNVQVLLNKIYIHRTISVMGDYTMSAVGPLYVIAQNAAVTITLPIVNSQFIGLEVTIDNKSAGNITVAVQADATSIEGETTQTLPFDCAMTMRFDGDSWRIV